MYYKQRKDGGKYIQSSQKPEVKKGRTFFYNSKDEAIKKHPDVEPELKYGTWRVEYK